MLALLALLALLPGVRTSVVRATGSGLLAPLLSCPNVDGSADAPHDVTVSDILAVVRHYGTSYGQPGYSFLYDSVDPYNPQAPTGTGRILAEDIRYVVDHFHDDCPLVDAQVAQATLAILNDPQASGILNCDEQVLASIGYLRSSTDVPGQGIHYVNLSYWDGIFDVTHPEGFVCQNGKLAAELYVVNGDASNIGWGTFNPSNGALHSIDIDTFCNPSPCSWQGSEGWHAHAFLCSYHIGTPSAVAIPLGPGTTDNDCQNIQNSTPCTNGQVQCPGTYKFNMRVGWMGHLWNILPNGNLLPDANSSKNGRFADCSPPTQAENCPM
jgi:hypothetical protein